ncbi:MAG: radical SAM protein [Candidatus Omnitrophica bacterium]|nr:radical SAM protein [Candidatus Omnitrophota bacterium]
MGVYVMVRFDRNAVVIFNPRNGDKLRFAVGSYTKAKRPELVDMKITDYCAFGCPFCYQGSTPLGEHATLDNITEAIRQMKKARVFEVAIGGGEPTTHPNFVEILVRFRGAGIVPNFTTKSLGWVKRNWGAIENTVGAFAFSCMTAKDVVSATKALSGVPRSRMNLHYVMGLENEAGFVAFLRAAHQHGFRVTLLGYKTTGRGGGVVPHDYSNWVDLVQLLTRVGACPTLSIDTPLAAEYEDRLPIPSYAFHTKEGFVSAYIDAVQMGLGASSFQQESLIPLSGDLIADYKKVVPV